MRSDISPPGYGRIDILTYLRYMQISCNMSRYICLENKYHNIYKLIFDMQISRYIIHLETKGLRPWSQSGPGPPGPSSCLGPRASGPAAHCPHHCGLGLAVQPGFCFKFDRCGQVEMNWFQVERFMIVPSHLCPNSPALDTLCMQRPTIGHTNMLHVRHRSRSGGQILPLATDSIFLLRYCMASDASHGPDLKLKKQFDPKFPRAQPLESYPLHEKQRTSLSRHPCPEGSFPLLICMSLWQKDAEYRFFSVRNTYLLVSSRMCFA